MTIKKEPITVKYLASDVARYLKELNNPTVADIETIFSLSVESALTTRVEANEYKVLILLYVLADFLTSNQTAKIRIHWKDINGADVEYEIIPTRILLSDIVGLPLQERNELRGSIYNAVREVLFINVPSGKFYKDFTLDVHDTHGQVWTMKPPHTM